MPIYLRTAAMVAVLLLLFAGCKTPVTAVPATQAITLGRVHVLLTSGTQPEAILEPFADYSFKVIGPASRSQNKHAYTYNAAAITANALENELKAHALVINAEVVK